jgi:hypothetical protein
MPHPIVFPRETKNRLSQAINERCKTIKISTLANREPNYTPVLIHVLNGFEYEDQFCKLIIRGVVVDQWKTEPWAGADFTVQTTLLRPREPEVRKATLLQSKLGRIVELPEKTLTRLLKQIEVKPKNQLGRMEHLLKQIQDMRKFTPHPKVLEVSKQDQEVPRVVSGVGILEGRRLQHQEFGDWIATSFWFRNQERLRVKRIEILL